MKPNTSLLRAALVAAVVFCPLAIGSDHADPMSTVNPFKPQDDPVANITDLHAFVVDKDRKPVLDESRIKEGDQLIISLCVRRSLLPWQIPTISNDVPKYSFRVHLDLNPEARFFDAAKTREGGDYQAAVATLNQQVIEATARRDAARLAAPLTNNMFSAAERAAQAALANLLNARGVLISQHQQDRSMQALYGGILDNPDKIAEEALLDFHLRFESDQENSEVSLDQSQLRIEGIPGQVNVVSEGRKSLDGKRDLVKSSLWKDGAINIQCGIFDDPFIFPRFFRGNVVGIVASIPLKLICRPDGTPAGSGPILLWATTHRPDGRQSDHVGRSLRTQLPRFGYLNGLHPSKHVAKIMRVHDAPDLLENILTTFIPPLEAHRHYDNAPDVMVYDLRKPAAFPNGRWFEDDVAKTLAEAGETLLVELSYAESRQFPRATTNDKPFDKDFPYLASRWTTQEVGEHAMPGTMFGDFKVPDAPDGGATALPDFVPAVWRSLWVGLVIGLLGAGVLAWLAVRGLLRKAVVVIVMLAGLCWISPVKAAALKPMDKGYMQQPQNKVIRMVLGVGFIAALGLTALYAVGVRRGLRIAARESILPLGEQGEGDDDRQYIGSTYREVHDAVFNEPYYGRTWGEANQKPLPVYHSNFGTIARGLFSLTRRHLFMDAAARTLSSHADLRWGGLAKKGVQRLLHPNGVCLAGIWKINEDTPYTGFFANGSEGRVIARYSTGLGVLRGQKRTLSMVGKLYPNLNAHAKSHPASFITQEDLGAAYTDSIYNAVLRNAPNITAWKRGFDIHSLLLIAFTFFRVDLRNTIRQLYEIAELGKNPVTPTCCPQFMQLTIAAPQGTRIGGGDDTADFRDEVLAQIYDRGEARPKRPLVFNIEVADRGKVEGLLKKELVGADWRLIGTITFEEAAASYNGDFVLHFHHPKWRANVNDPSSETGSSDFARSINGAAQWLRHIAGLLPKRK